MESKNLISTAYPPFDINAQGHHADSERQPTQPDEDVFHSQNVSLNSCCSSGKLSRNSMVSRVRFSCSAICSSSLNLASDDIKILIAYLPCYVGLGDLWLFNRFHNFAPQLIQRQPPTLIALPIQTMIHNPPVIIDNIKCRMWFAPFRNMTTCSLQFLQNPLVFCSAMIFLPFIHTFLFRF